MKLRIATSLGTVLLGACGAEVASTAATSATLQATQLQQARSQQQQVTSKLDDALKVGEARASAASQ